MSDCNAVCQIIKVLLKHSQKHIDGKYDTAFESNSEYSLQS